MYRFCPFGIVMIMDHEFFVLSEELAVFDEIVFLDESAEMENA